MRILCDIKVIEYSEQEEQSGVGVGTCTNLPQATNREVQEEIGIQVKKEKKGEAKPKTEKIEQMITIKMEMKLI